MYKDLKIACVSSAGTREQPRFALLWRLAARMALTSVQESPSAQMLLRGAFYMLLGTLLAEFPLQMEGAGETPHDDKNMKTIQTVTNWLEKNYADKITLEQAARVARYNRTYFSYLFKHSVGIPFYEYLTRIRFRHALWQLGNTDKSLTDIAYDCGFADLKTFSAYYKKNLHEIPSARRASMGTHRFTSTAEDERVFLDSDDSGINEILSSYVRLSAIRTGVVRPRPHCRPVRTDHHIVRAARGEV